MLREQLSSLRVVWLNGEVVPVSLVKLALDVLPESARVFNTYSISETNDVCTIELTGLRLDGMDTCPVGYPMDGVKVRVRPQDGSAPASSGVGELLIGGKALARGYPGRPDLDSRSFVFWNGERYYATGDLAEVEKDGMTTIIGRTDSMVKIRGYSVYSGAIEETLRKHCDASDAAVVAESLDETSKRLVAYIVRGPQASWTVDSRSGTSRDLRALLERKALSPLRNERPVARRRTVLSKYATAEERRDALRELWAETLDVDSDAL